ncbi:MAG: hypothetical protein WCB11_05900 [Terriglobales bacterium]
MKRIPLNPAEIDKLLKQHGFFKGSPKLITSDFSDPLFQQEQAEESLWQIYRRPGGCPPRDRDSSVVWIRQSSNHWQLDYHRQTVGKGCLDDGSLAEFLRKSPPGSPLLSPAESENPDSLEKKTAQLAGRILVGDKADGRDMEAARDDDTYEGWTNWETWNVALLIDNSESTVNAKRRLALNALQKGIGIDQLTDQFRRMLRKQEDEVRQYHEDNAADARDERGAYERQELEGTKPESTGDAHKDAIRDAVNGLMKPWCDMGGTSDWEEPMEEVNWRAIAWKAAEEEEHWQKTNGKELEKKLPGYTGYDKDMLKNFGISFVPETSVQTKEHIPIAKHSNGSVKEAVGEITQEDFDFVPGKRRVWCNQCEMISINGVPCHESDCPNQSKVWDPNAIPPFQSHRPDREYGEWVDPPATSRQ